MFWIRLALAFKVPERVKAERVSVAASKVMPPLAAIAPEAVKVVTPVIAPPKLVVRALTVSKLPAPQFKGEMLMLPVVSPPKVKALFLKDWTLASDAESTNPLLLVEAESVSIGVPAAMPVSPNLAEEVACPPSRKSTVELLGTITPPETCSKGEVPAPPVLSVPQVTRPLESVFKVQVA